MELHKTMSVIAIWTSVAAIAWNNPLTLCVTVIPAVIATGFFAD